LHFRAFDPKSLVKRSCSRKCSCKQAHKAKPLAEDSTDQESRTAKDNLREKKMKGRGVLEGKKMRGIPREVATPER
jgi:hypothetical protein